MRAKGDGLELGAGGVSGVGFYNVRVKDGRGWEESKVLERQLGLGGDLGGWGRQSTDGEVSSGSKKSTRGGGSVVGKLGGKDAIRRGHEKGIESKGGSEGGSWGTAWAVWKAGDGGRVTKEMVGEVVMQVDEAQPMGIGFESQGWRGEEEWSACRDMGTR
ncbi:hypothetical protein AMTR_s00110p00153150 [Amborella trichopoda]|uniref:Uncharacterized protein n=1 Tax=Amborella trichopoda TaxID=13333 RepID=W1NXK1_AMBTC|nr:hypothetical protein AMTR_s00110p00153150 [Amborella trichopoda]